MTSQITYVALDVGNVLLNVNFNPFVEALSKYLNISKDEAQYSVSGSCKMHDLGLTSMKIELKDHFKIKSEVVVRELLEVWNASISPNLSIIESILEWTLENDLHVALLSNVGLEHVEIMKKEVCFPNSVGHFSCYVGARKPTYIYYQSFLQIHPEFAGCAYLDDLQENLDAGAKFGFRPYRFALDESTSADLPNVSKKKILDIQKFIFQK